MGSSPREKEAQNVQNRYKSLYNEIGGIDTGSIKNKFEGYEDPFNYGSMKGNLDKIYSSAFDDLERTSAGDVSRAGRETTEGLASQGVTGGSILNSAVDRAKNPIYKNKFNTIGDLTRSKASADIGLMENENERKFRNTSASSNMDLRKLYAIFQKYGALQGNLGAQQGNLSAYSDSSTLDDILGIGNTAAGFLNPLDKLLGNGAGRAG